MADEDVRSLAGYVGPGAATNERPRRAERESLSSDRGTWWSMSRCVVTLGEMGPSEARSGIPWRVVAVFDPNGGGGDFAYTVGLFNVGLPEVHVWARPTDGTDPGEDFSLRGRADRWVTLAGT